METKELKYITDFAPIEYLLLEIFDEDEINNLVNPIDEFGNEINEFNPETEYLEITVKRISK
jgi:hypothetical protein